MSRSLLCTALLIATVSTLAIVTIATVTGAITPDALAGRDRAATSPIVSTHESSGLDLRSDQTSRTTLAAPNYTLDGPGAVSPDPYHPAPEASCTVPYQTTAGDKTILKYGTVAGCAEDAAPRPITDSGTHA
ncbi:MAG TPA: hypothetical protein VNP95_02255 [Thermomicrobiales bacterium]|jgi:hypothetical protein|nr:hypothetical protein [Thermomicrobiales bacterium]